MAWGRGGGTPLPPSVAWKRPHESPHRTKFRILAGEQSPPRTLFGARTWSFTGDLCPKSKENPDFCEAEGSQTPTLGSATGSRENTEDARRDIQGVCALPASAAVTPGQMPAAPCLLPRGCSVRRHSDIFMCPSSEAAWMTTVWALLSDCPGLAVSNKTSEKSRGQLSGCAGSDFSAPGSPALGPAVADPCACGALSFLLGRGHLRTWRLCVFAAGPGERRGCLLKVRLTAWTPSSA